MDAHAWSVECESPYAMHVRHLATVYKYYTSVQVRNDDKLATRSTIISPSLVV
jgi:hypothetical protein